MKREINSLINRIEAFDDTDELCRWLDDYREDVFPGICEERYYLEEIRQNLVGMNDLLQCLRKELRQVNNQSKSKTEILKEWNESPDLQAKFGDIATFEYVCNWQKDPINMVLLEVVKFLEKESKEFSDENIYYFKLWTTLIDYVGKNGGIKAIKEATATLSDDYKKKLQGYINDNFDA